MVISNSYFTGSITSSRVGYGIDISGANTVVYSIGNIYALCVRGANIYSNAELYFLSSSFRDSNYHIYSASGAVINAEACTFTVLISGDNPIYVTDAGTKSRFVGCTFDGRDNLGVSHGTALVCVSAAILRCISCYILYFITGIQIGGIFDESDTQTTISATTIQFATNSIVQNGSTTLKINLSILEPTTILINDSTNVNIHISDLTIPRILIGKFANTDTDIIGVLSGNSGVYPMTKYISNLYGYQGHGFINPNVSASSVYNISKSNALLTNVSSTLSRFFLPKLVSSSGL
jgi:hypothetical protein